VKIINLLLIFIFLFSCATPEVVTVKSPSDEKKNCGELEILVSEAQKFKRDALYEKENTGGNMARMILFWPAMATTFYNADKAIRAADDRTYHLMKIMKKKNCKNLDVVNSAFLKSSTENIAGQLNMLKEMFRSGDLTKEEFSKAKKKVLESE
tara:strand:- start:1791 stop:2249 length:459 start_codon:yes stop_codon:yes gene_type:complete